MRWLVKDALLQDREDDRKTVDRKTVSVYAFAPTKIANMAFERWYDLNVPLSFNFIMKYDPTVNWQYIPQWRPSFSQVTRPDRPLYVSHIRCQRVSSLIRIHKYACRVFESTLGCFLRTS